MSVLPLKRVMQFVVATTLAVPLLANHPSPRIQPRMVFDDRAGAAVLFGGRALDDPATGLVHASDETWIWINRNWIQQFPAHKPPARSAQAMAYDSTRGRVMMFGGRKEATQLRTTFSLLDDTWVWENGDWRQLETATRPPARTFAAMTYDRDRDRMILFGGYRFAADNRTLEPLSDTWEFDGTDWRQVASGSPEVDKPLLAYDAARRQTIMLALDETLKTLMYRWDPASSAWQSVSPANLPSCVNEGQLAYQSHNQRLIVAGGVCADTQAIETWEWDGTNWTKLETNGVPLVTGATAAYDPAGRRLIRYGGQSAFGTESYTYVLYEQEWTFTHISGTPPPRSLFVFKRDPVREALWVVGGLSEFSVGTSISYVTDHWKYAAGEWYQVQTDGIPISCVTPLSAFDTDRGVLVVICGGNEVNEWDGTKWTAVEAEKPPTGRRFAALVYDQNIKKTVLFGGYDNVNYRQDTWTWDGKTWTEVKANKKPPHRGQMAMWYDPLAKKTIMYSGIGRRDINERVTRYADMWSFDGTTWTEMTNVQTPGIRFGAQVAVDPRDGKVLLFGGLRATVDEKKNVSNFYGNDLWQWDGSANRWTQLAQENAPPARQNGGLEFDPASGKFLLFGGYAGNFYFSDLWTWDGQRWTPVPASPVTMRRRAARP